MPALPRALARNGWTIGPVMLGVFAMLASIIVTLDAWSDIYRIATQDEEYSHIFLVPIVAAWLFWVRRERFRRCPVRRTWLGPAIVAFGWILYSVGDLQLLQALWHMGALVMLIGCFISIAGVDVLVRFFPAFLVFAFMVPVPGVIRQQIALPLQSATASVTQGVLEVIGVEVEQTGNVLIINGVSVAIAEACNGLRMVFALLLVSVAFAFGTPLRLFMQVLLIVVSPISAILCNVIRLVPTVWLYGNTSEGFAVQFHDISGWVMLPISFLILMGVIRALRWAFIPVHRYTLAYGS